MTSPMSDEEAVARFRCKEAGYDPDELNGEDGLTWEIWADEAKRILATLRNRGWGKTEWLDIETAPKDGTQILMASEYSRDIAICRWYAKRWEVVADGNRAIAYMSDFGTDYLTFDVPNKWQPLPQPPAPTPPQGGK